jgi:hypothetical protein
MTIEQTIAAIIAGIFILICCAAGKSKTEEPPDPKDLEVRTNTDGSAAVINYKTEDVIGTFSTRAEAEAFLVDLKA